MERTSVCTCGLFDKFSRDSQVPISRDEAGNYHLQLTSTRSVQVYACSFCGGHELGEDSGLYEGGELCTCGSIAAWALDPELPVTYNERLVVAVFGKPDSESGPIIHTAEYKTIYNARDMRRTIYYGHIWESLRAFFQEMEDGTIWSGCSGKPIRRSLK